MTPTTARRLLAVLIRNMEMDAARADAVRRVVQMEWPDAATTGPDGDTVTLGEQLAALRLALDALEAQARETVKP